MGDIISPVCSTLVKLQLKYFRKNVNRSERVQWKSRKIIQGLENVIYVGSLKELTAFRLANRRMMPDITEYKYVKGFCKTKKSYKPILCPLGIGQEITSCNYSKGK